MESKELSNFKLHGKLVGEMLLEMKISHEFPNQTIYSFRANLFGKAERQPYLEIGRNTSKGLF